MEIMYVFGMALVTMDNAAARVIPTKAINIAAAISL